MVLVNLDGRMVQPTEANIRVEVGRVKVNTLMVGIRVFQRVNGRMEF